MSWALDAPVLSFGKSEIPLSAAPLAERKAFFHLMLGVVKITAGNARTAANVPGACIVLPPDTEIPPALPADVPASVPILFMSTSTPHIVPGRCPSFSTTHFTPPPLG